MCMCMRMHVALIVRGIKVEGMEEVMEAARVAMVEGMEVVTRGGDGGGGHACSAHEKKTMAAKRSDVTLASTASSTNLAA